MTFALIVVRYSIYNTANYCHLPNNLEKGVSHQRNNHLIA